MQHSAAEQAEEGAWLMSNSPKPPTLDAPASAPVQSNGAPGLPDRLGARAVLWAIVQQSAPHNSEKLVLGRDSLVWLFWLAHLYYARKNPGYLTAWPLIRKPWGAEVLELDAILKELIEDGLVRAEQVDCGPMPLMSYVCTGKPLDFELRPQVLDAVREAHSFFTADKAPGALWNQPFPLSFSRAWRITPDGEELNIYLDLIPDDAYEDGRRMLEELTRGLEGVFS
jgi:hypothetical protein